MSTVKCITQVLGAAAFAQAAVFVLSGSVALLADLIHNVGDALTAVPLGIALLVLGIAGSTRTRRLDWVQVRDADNGTDLVVLRGSNGFDADARRLFTASLRP